MTGVTGPGFGSPTSITGFFLIHPFKMTTEIVFANFVQPARSIGIWYCLDLCEAIPMLQVVKLDRTTYNQYCQIYLISASFDSVQVLFISLMYIYNPNNVFTDLKSFWDYYVDIDCVSCDSMIRGSREENKSVISEQLVTTAGETSLAFTQTKDKKNNRQKGKKAISEKAIL